MHIPRVNISSWRVLFHLPYIILFNTAPSEPEPRPESANGLLPEIADMLEPDSRLNYQEGIEEIQSNKSRNKSNFSTALPSFFFVFEREFDLSATQWLRWCHYVDMPYFYAKLVVGKKIYSHGRDGKRKVNLNSSYPDNPNELKASTVGETLNCIENYCETYCVTMIGDCDQAFFQACRTLADQCNPHRHYQRWFVPYAEIMQIKERLDSLLNTYLPAMYVIKQKLSGKAGDIGIPPGRPARTDSTHTAPDDSNLLNYPDTNSTTTP